MKIPFTKMQGIGNDYIYVNCMSGEYFDPAELSVKMSPRHMSVGADGLVLICSSDTADAKMRMFNADGSEGRMCGNAIRCVGKYLYENGIVDKINISVETLSGIKYLTLTVENGKVSYVSVDMGTASFVPCKIPVVSESELINAPITVPSGGYRFTAVTVGNPHAVIYADEIDSLDLYKIGPEFENNELFPERINTEFVKVISDTHLQMRVWERGSGETWACGTGACAVVAASVKNGICSANTEITVTLIGGDLKITCSDDYRLTMRGAAVKVYDGVFDTDDFDI
jgi:diaminopimelate epimerase